MSYSALLASLASTPKGHDDWRTIFGTLLRQAYNDGARFKPRVRASGESQRQEARRRGVSLYRVRVDRGASTGKGAGVRARGGMVSASRVVADLRSVGWGGTDSAVREAYDVMQIVFTLPPQRESQARGDLNNFNAKPPAGWQKTERGPPTAGSRTRPSSSSPRATTRRGSDCGAPTRRISPPSTAPCRHQTWLRPGPALRRRVRVRREDRHLRVCRRAARP